MSTLKSTIRRQGAALAAVQIQWIGGLLLFVLCANVFRTVDLYRPLHVRLINGLIVGVLLNVTLFTSLLQKTNRWRFLFILPLTISGAGTAFVMSAYHAILIPLVLVFYFWIGFNLFGRGAR
jgi:hypothetical protein